MNIITGVQVFLRSFLIQASWNYERLLNLGFLFAIYPALKAIYDKGDQLKAAMSRQIQFFNAHPYMSSYALGAMIRLEEQHKDGTIDENTISRLRKALCTPLGSIGDQFFWALWRPMCGLVGVTVFLIWNPIGAICVYLILYNIPHLFVRMWGLYRAYRHGFGITKIFSRPTFRWSIARANEIGAFVFGFFVVVICIKQYRSDSIMPLVFIFGSAAISFALLRRLPATLTVLILMVCTILFRFVLASS